MGTRGAGVSIRAPNGAHAPPRPADELDFEKSFPHLVAGLNPWQYSRDGIYHGLSPEERAAKEAYLLAKYGHSNELSWVSEHWNTRWVVGGGCLVVRVGSSRRQGRQTRVGKRGLCKASIVACMTMGHCSMRQQQI